MIACAELLGLPATQLGESLVSWVKAFGKEFITVPFSVSAARSNRCGPQS